jgi:prephenate dehydrogenase
MQIAIIGGYGKMGMWFARNLKKEGMQVIIGGRNRDKLAQAAGQLKVEAATAREAVEKADTVILSVPIDSFEEIVEDIAPFTHDGQLIFDVTSVKVMPVSAMHKHLKDRRILGVHPMFGPGADGIANQRFVLTPTNKDEEALAEQVRKHLEDRQARVITMSPQEHDEIISVVLGLSHFIALVSADTLFQTGKLDKAAPVSGTTFKLLLTLAESVLNEDPAFYASLQMHLPGAAKVEKLMADNAASWAGIVKNGDSRQFAEKMAALKEGFLKADPRFRDAYKEMYKIIGGY